MHEDFINKNYLYAVVGANTDPTRYGYIILDNLSKKGYKVVGVNPKYNKINQVACYPSLNKIPSKPQVVVFVVPPEAGLKVLDEVKELGDCKVWLQPGTYNNEVVEKAKKLELAAVADGSCIMVLTSYAK